MLPAETIFENIGNFLNTSDVRVATAADIPAPREQQFRAISPPRRTLGLLQRPMTPEKRLVIFCDGSWFGKESTSRSNIRMIADMVGDVQCLNPGALGSAVVHPIRPNQANIVAGYQEGASTGHTFLDFAWDSTTGAQISDECVSVYRFIVEHYTDDHEIWLFGFSRGAYTVRSVAGMINNCGIVRRQKDVLTSEQLNALCYEVYRTYRSTLPEDSPSSEQFKRFRSNTDRVWQVKQPIRFMGLIDSVGSLGIPHVPGDFDPTPFEFFDRYVPSVVQHVYHAVALHDRLSILPPCLVQTSEEKSAATVINQKWFPGTHYDLGRTAFRFFPRHPGNHLAVLFGLAPDLLSRTVMPNEVLADRVLMWLMSGMQDMDPHGWNPFIENLEAHKERIRQCIATPTPNTTGSGDIYGDVLRSLPLDVYARPIRLCLEYVVSLWHRTITPMYSDATLYSSGVQRIRRILFSTNDRRIPVFATDVDDFQDEKGSKSGESYSLEESARMCDLDEGGRMRYPSRTYSTFQLWTEVFGKA
jgi:hypothetical protein